MQLAQDHTGRTFGRLLVLGPAPAVRNRNKRYLCRCECGQERVVLSCHLVGGATASCGCLRNDRMRAACMKHGHRGTKTYHAWKAMRQRCTNPKRREYANYGGRGIRVCERWGEYLNFLSDMGAAPPDTSLDRIDPNGNYEPGNCRWASALTQSLNRRTAVLITFQGETLNVSEWERRFGLRRGLVNSRRARGWDAVRAITTPQAASTCASGPLPEAPATTEAS